MIKVVQHISSYLKSKLSFPYKAQQDLQRMKAEEKRLIADLEKTIELEKEKKRRVSETMDYLVKAI